MSKMLVTELHLTDPWSHLSMLNLFHGELLALYLSPRLVPR